MEREIGSRVEGSEGFMRSDSTNFVARLVMIWRKLAVSLVGFE